MKSEFVARALKCPPTKKSTAFSCVTTDSRKVPKDSLFVAIAGERFDGHTFVAQAYKMGATGFVVRRDFKIPKECTDAAFFLVDDTLEAIRALAAAWRQEFDIPLIAVAGSSGKTTTKELLASILSGKWKKILKTEKSQNGFLGVAITLLELRPEHEAAVVEIGIDEPGAMIRHLEVVRPNASLITSIGPEHLEKLRDLKTVAEEESLAITEVHDHGGSVAINLNDTHIALLAKKVGSERALTYFLGEEKPKAKLPMVFGLWDSKRSSLHVEHSGESFDLALSLEGWHNAQNVLAATAMALLVGLKSKEIQKGLASFRPIEGRSEVHQSKTGAKVFCDYYNANPLSVDAALKTMVQWKDKTVWVCLADMLELGAEEEQYHRQLAPKIIGSGAKHVLLHGQRMQWVQDELKKLKFGGKVQWFSDTKALGETLAKSVKRDDVVLIKGSRSMKMEKVWELIK